MSALTGVLGCAVCFGADSGSLALGAQAGVLVLASVITVVLGGIVAVIWTFRTRALRLDAAARESPPSGADARH